MQTRNPTTPNPSALPARMRAAICGRWGPPEVLRLVDRPVPRPGKGEVLIRNLAATVASGDARMRGLNVPRGLELGFRLAMGWSGPRNDVLGVDCAGLVVAVGPGVTRFAPGDRVMALTGMAGGGNGQYLCLKADGAIGPAPEGWSHEAAATLPFGGTTALDFLTRKARLAAGERVLVNGASGAVGVAMVQIARAMGAEVTGVSSGPNAGMLRELGVEEVIDYTRTDFRIETARWDVLADTVGNVTIAAARRVLRRGGRFLRLNADLPGMLGGLLPRPGIRVFAGPASVRPEDFLRLKQMAEAGQIAPVIDRTYSLDLIAEAHAYVETGRKRGSVILDLG